MAFRYVIYALATACITLVYSLRLSFNSTIICQYSVNDSGHYLNDSSKRAWTFSSVSFGLVLGLLFLAKIQTLGTRYVFGIFGALGCVSSLLYPLSDSYGFWSSFIIRIIQGMPGAIFLWSMSTVTTEWAPKSEIGLSIACLSSLYQLGPVIAMITAGEMCSSIGWEFTYYALSVLTIVVFVVFHFVYNDDLTRSRFVSKEEATLIREGKAQKTEGQAIAEVPYSEALRDIQVWIVWFIYFCFFFGAYIFLMYGPTYINQVLLFDVRKTGYASAAPHLLTLVLKIFYGRFLDSKGKLTQKQRMNLAFSIVEIVSACCLGLLILTSSARVALGVYFVFNSLHGLVVIVIMKHVHVISRQHSHFLSNGNTAIVALCLFVTPVVVNFIVPNNTAHQWALLFLGVALLMMISVGLFVFCAASKASKWTEVIAEETGDECKLVV